MALASGIAKARRRNHLIHRGRQGKTGKDFTGKSISEFGEIDAGHLWR
jgi:hypothetical protein